MYNGLNARQDIFYPMIKFVIEELPRHFFFAKTPQQFAIAFGRPYNDDRGRTEKHDTNRLLYDKWAKAPIRWYEKQESNNTP